MGKLILPSSKRHYPSSAVKQTRMNLYRRQHLPRVHQIVRVDRPFDEAHQSAPIPPPFPEGKGAVGVMTVTVIQGKVSFV